MFKTTVSAEPVAWDYGFTAEFWTLLDVSQSNFLQLTEAKTLNKLKFHGQFVFQKLQHF